MEVTEVMRSMLEAVEGEFYLLEVLEAMRCVLLCMLEVVGGRLCLLEMPEMIRGVLEAVERRLFSLAGGVGGAGGDALCATPYAKSCGGCALFTRGDGGAERAGRT